MPSYYDSTAQTRSAVEASKTVKSYGESVGPRGVKMGKPTTQPQGHVPMKKRYQLKN